MSAAERLAAHLGTPPGMGHVEVYSDRYVVRVSPSVRLAAQPDEWEGRPVRYERMRPAKAGEAG